MSDSFLWKLDLPLDFVKVFWLAAVLFERSGQLNLEMVVQILHLFLIVTHFFAA
jgi:hypothetical protein